MFQPEAWLLGRAEGYSDALMPAVHSLLQARSELTALADDVSPQECRVTLGGAASIGFHVAHIAGSLDRLFTYARDEPLSAEQLDAVGRESERGSSESQDDLFGRTIDRIDACLEVLKEVPEDSLYDTRAVGRQKLPSNVVGLLFHAAEHTTMHVGQIRTTLRVIRGLEVRESAPSTDLLHTAGR